MPLWQNPDFQMARKSSESVRISRANHHSIRLGLYFLTHTHMWQYLTHSHGDITKDIIEVEKFGSEEAQKFLHKMLKIRCARKNFEVRAPNFFLLRSNMNPKFSLAFQFRSILSQLNHLKVDLQGWFVFA